MRVETVSKGTDCAAKAALCTRKKDKGKKVVLANRSPKGLHPRKQSRAIRGNRLWPPCNAHERTPVRAGAPSPKGPPVLRGERHGMMRFGIATLKVLVEQTAPRE